MPTQVPSSGSTAENTSRDVSARSSPDAVRIATDEITAMLPTLTPTITAASHLRVDASDAFAELAMAPTLASPRTISRPFGTGSRAMCTSSGINQCVEGSIALAVNGTLMRGLERNANLVEAGATFDREARTAPCYRLWSIDDVHPAMLRDATQGRSIAVEVWLVPPAGVAAILLSEPAGLCVGRLTLDDGSEVLGVLAEPALVEDRREITEHGGWRAYLATTAPAA